MDKGAHSSQRFLAAPLECLRPTSAHGLASGLAGWAMPVTHKHTPPCSQQAPGSLQQLPPSSFSLQRGKVTATGAAVGGRLM